MREINTRATTSRHESMWQELCAVLLKYEMMGVPPIELLAVVSRLSGKIIACLNPFEFTSEMAMTVVSENLTRGNEDMQRELLKGKN